MFKLATNSVLASEIAEYLGREFHGEDIVIYWPSSPESVSDNSLFYSMDIKKINMERIEGKEEVLALLDADPGEDFPADYIISENPELDFIKVVDKFFSASITPVIHDKAVIESGARIGENVSVYAGAYIGPDVEIGDNTVISQNVVITGNVRIGKNCVIKANATIGSEIFNFAKSEEEWAQFPQVGKIIIEDNVWIGANSTVEKGTLTDTFIGHGAKIDDLVQIGSGASIGENVIIAAGTILSKNIHVDKNAWISTNVSVRDDIKIGKDSVIGMGSVVIGNVNPGTTVAGNPAKILEKK